MLHVLPPCSPATPIEPRGRPIPVTAATLGIRPFASAQQSTPAYDSPVNSPFLITALLCLLLATQQAKANNYQLVTEEWAPYNYEEDGQLTGMATEIVRAIMARTGDAFEIVLRPSMRTSLMLQNRPKTIMFSMFRTPEREALYKWVGPIAEESIRPWQLTSAAHPVETLEQLLRAPQITTRHAGLVPGLLESLGFNNLDKRATESVQLCNMLRAGRSEIIIGDTDAGVAHYSAQLHLPPGTLRPVPIELYRASLYIAFSQDSDDERVAAWAEALEALRSSGELLRIQQRYEHAR